MTDAFARGSKDTIYEQFARIGQAVASPRRLELLDLLSQGPRTVDALACQATQSLANTSQHLQVLRELLRMKGFQAVRLEDGVHEWRAQGFKVAVSEGPGR